MATSVEICTGGGGQALGLEWAGFEHRAVVEIDPHACNTLRANRGEQWNVIEADLLEWDPSGYAGVDLVAGGVPCPPFSKAGRQIGAQDERDLFPRALEIVEAIRPKVVMLENVRGFLDARFDDYRSGVVRRLEQLGYRSDFRLLNASDFGVPQLRPRVVMVAVADGLPDFEWPTPSEKSPPTVGEALRDLMAEHGWRGVDEWAERADKIGPTLVGGSKKHGGPDLGPTRARNEWAAIGVNGKSLALDAPEPDFEGMPRLTVRMAARIQGFPDDWEFTGKKTNAYRQVGNAFPPPVAAAVGAELMKVIGAGADSRERGAA